MRKITLLVILLILTAIGVLLFWLIVGEGLAFLQVSVNSKLRVR